MSAKKRLDTIWSKVREKKDCSGAMFDLEYSITIILLSFDEYKTQLQDLKKKQQEVTEVQTYYKHNNSGRGALFSKQENINSGEINAYSDNPETYIVDLDKDNSDDLPRPENNTFRG